MVNALWPVKTANARIRVATDADAAFIASTENDDELKQFVGGATGKSEECYRTFLRSTPDLRFLIVESPDRTRIGVCGLLTGSFGDECELRVVLLKDYWGRGLGTEVARALKRMAAEVYPHMSVTARVHPDNAASMSIVERLGPAETATIAGDSYDGWTHFTWT